MVISVQDRLQQTFTFPGKGRFWVIKGEVWEEKTGYVMGRPWPHLVRVSPKQARKIRLIMNNSLPLVAFQKKAAQFDTD